MGEDQATPLQHWSEIRVLALALLRPTCVAAFPISLPWPLAEIISHFLSFPRFRSELCHAKYSLSDDGLSISWGTSGYEGAWADLLMHQGVWRWQVVLPHRFCWIGIGAPSYGEPTLVTTPGFHGVNAGKLATHPFDSKWRDRAFWPRRPLRRESGTIHVTLEYQTGPNASLRVSFSNATNPIVLTAGVPPSAHIAFGCGTVNSQGGTATIRFLCQGEVLS
eukprot:TRINITY_DN44270_c0_g1_i1.p1 TRINITY_DN44270_c0_g1~~TRINITY_DN44270_c0_g1_i1.p1  ORF type:complete len:221 (+),score=10.55 TRINITY_DN44270_c0_g1_i1:31-693(+)